MFNDDECPARDDCKLAFRDEFEREMACRGCDEIHPSTEYCPKMFAKKEEWENQARREAHQYWVDVFQDAADRCADGKDKLRWTIMAKTARDKVDES